MGRAARSRPIHLGDKLLRIRLALGLSQEKMVVRLGADALTAASISAYELGQREPPLVVLLEYARLGNVYMEALVDDRVDLPAKLPAAEKSEGIERPPSATKDHR